MPANRALWRALHCLNHPLSIAAIVLLLVNDLWLRQHYPSWLTGKLGDVAWLVFAPFIAAVGFALVLPRRIRRREDVVALSAFALVGLIFTLGKAVPAANQSMADAWEWVFGSATFTRLDPSDLLALPALMVTWWIWRRVPATPTFPRPLAYGIAAIGILATMGNLAPLGYCTSEPPKTAIESPGYEYWLALTLGLLVLTTSTAYVRHLLERPTRRRGLLLFGWLSWVCLTLLIGTHRVNTSLQLGCAIVPGESAPSNDFKVYYGLYSLVLLLFLAIPMSTAAVWDLVRNLRTVLLPVVLTTALVGLSFLLPFEIWSWSGGYTPYGPIHFMATVLTGIELVVAYLFLRRVLSPVYERHSGEGR